MTDNRRRGTRAPRTTGALHQQPYGQVPRPYAPIEVLSADQIEAIHTAALRVLAEIGMKVLEPRARAFFAQALRRAQASASMPFSALQSNTHGSGICKVSDDSLARRRSPWCRSHR